MRFCHNSLAQFPYFWPEREKGNAWTFYRDTAFIQNVGPVKLCSDAERGYGRRERGLGVKLIEWKIPEDKSVQFGGVRLTDVLCQKMAQIYFTVDTKTDLCNTIFALWTDNVLLCKRIKHIWMEKMYKQVCSWYDRFRVNSSVVEELNVEC